MELAEINEVSSRTFEPLSRLGHEVNLFPGHRNEATVLVPRGVVDLPHDGEIRRQAALRDRPQADLRRLLANSRGQPCNRSSGLVWMSNQ